MSDSAAGTAGSAGSIGATAPASTGSASSRLATSAFHRAMGRLNDHDGLVRVRLGPASAFLVGDPALVRQVLVDNAANYIKGSAVAGIRLALGEGLFTADNPLWRRQRLLMNPAFHADHLARISAVFVDVLDAEVAGLDQAARQGASLPLLDVLIRANAEMVLRTLIDVEGSPTSRAEITGLIDAVFSGMARRMLAIFLPSWVPVPGRAAYHRAITALDEHIRRIIAHRRSDPVDRGDLLGMLLAAVDGDGNPMSDTQLRDEIFTMFLAGNESTATSTAWTFVLLSQAPDVATRLRAELDEVLAGRAPTLQDLPRLDHTRRVVAEGMRLYPAFPMYFRTAVAADRLGPHDVRAGSYVVLAPYATHRRPDAWSEPERFDPDRFAAPGSDRDRPEYYPFGFGQRQCIGRVMARSIAQLTVATVMARFDLDSGAGQVAGRYAMTYQPVGLELRLQPRT